MKRETCTYCGMTNTTKSPLLCAACEMGRVSATESHSGWPWPGRNFVWMDFLNSRTAHRPLAFAAGLLAAMLRRAAK